MLEVDDSTTVVIVGGGVAGLTAAMLLRRSGVGCVVLERQPRARVEARQRAGLVEYRGIRMFEERDLGRLLGDFPADNRLEIRVDGVSRFFGDDPYTSKLSGRLVPQQALVRNLIRAFIEDGGDLRFEAADVALDGLDTDRPVVRYVGADGAVREIACDFVAGCDGDHGVTNASVPDGAVTVHEHDYRITWLAVQAEAPPPRHALMAAGERGYAAHYFRGPALSRFYLQVDPADTVADWPEARIWEELRFRLHRPELPTGPVTETELFRLRALVREPMTYGRLYLLGDAAHVISPMGAKGMNLALFDAEVFAAAVRACADGDGGAALRGYSAACLERTWRYQEWSHWQSDMIFGLCPQNADPFRQRLARARFEQAIGSDAGARAWAGYWPGLA